MTNFKSNPRVHIFGFTFMPNQSIEMYNTFKRVIQDNVSLNVFGFAKWKNIYISNRKLGDEFRYVFDRRYLKRYIGNTLDRPQLVLKRQFIRNTAFDMENIQGGSAYTGEMEALYESQQQMLVP
jgi:hypothetical protein